jgi:hypothetical protein
VNREAMLKAAQQGQRLTIYLNGVEQSHVTDADPDAGWIDRVSFNSSGGMIFDGGEVVTERRFGYVEVKAEPPSLFTIQFGAVVIPC